MIAFKLKKTPNVVNFLKLMVSDNEHESNRAFKIFNIKVSEMITTKFEEEIDIRKLGA